MVAEEEKTSYIYFLFGVYAESVCECVCLWGGREWYTNLSESCWGNTRGIRVENGDDIVLMCKILKFKKKMKEKEKKRIIPNGPLVSQLLTINLVLNY